MNGTTSPSPGIRGKEAIQGAYLNGRWTYLPDIPVMTLNGQRFSRTTADGWTFTFVISQDCETIRCTLSNGADMGTYYRIHR